MFTVSKLYCFVVLAGLVASVVEARPLDPIEENGIVLSARMVKAKGNCAAKKKTAAAGKTTHVTGAAKTPGHKVRRDGELNELFPRTHPLPSGRLDLYHGTTKDREADFDHFDITKAPKSGDFHFGKEGFYMTEQLDHAVEYACKSWCLLPDEVAVVI
ncbi:hypothetical protein H0H93_009838, partial [Arthromyces matolae]